MLLIRGQKTESRVSYLDGVRGVAALSVVLAHAQEFYPSFNNWRGHARGPWGDTLFHLVTFPFQAGTFAVDIFFVLSGFVIAQSASRGNAPVALAAIRRYLRLTIPMASAAVVAWFLLRFLPGETAIVGPLAENEWIGRLYAGGPVSLYYALGDAVWRVYWQGYSYIDPVLWTMKVELIGSVCVYMFYALVPQMARVIALLAVVLVTSGYFGGFYLGFALGTLLHEMNRMQWLRSCPPLGVCMIALGLLGGALCQSSLLWPGLIWLSRAGMLDKDPAAFCWSCSAAALIAGVVFWPRAQSILSRRIPRFFGRISFCLYLIHLPILCTVAACVYVSLCGSRILTYLMLWETAYVAFSIVVAWGLTVLVDEPTVRALKNLGRYRTNFNQANSAQKRRPDRVAVARHDGKNASLESDG